LFRGESRIFLDSNAMVAFPEGVQAESGRRATMAAVSVDRDELVRKIGADPEFLRQTLEWLLQQLMEAEVRERIGADRYDRTPDRTPYRNGHRPRDWDTRLGTLHLAIPKLRQGRDFPGFLEPRKRREHALMSVIQEAYVNGVSTRKVDQLVQALGLEGVSKSSVSRVAQELDARLTAFRERPLEGRYPYVWWDARVRESPRRGPRVQHGARGGDRNSRDG
jgi:transposase-like protein